MSGPLVVTPLLVSPPQLTCALAPSLPKSEILSILKMPLRHLFLRKELVPGTLCLSQPIVHKAVTAHMTVILYFIIFICLLYFFNLFRHWCSWKKLSFFLLTPVCLAQHLIPCNSDQMDVEYRNENLRSGQKSDTSETYVKKTMQLKCHWFPAHTGAYRKYVS